MADEMFKALNADKKANKEKKRLKNRKLFDKYNLKIIKEYANIVTFEQNNKVFYFTEITGKIREQGSRVNQTLTSFLNGCKITIPTKNFVEKESYAHAMAKDILYSWLKDSEKATKDSQNKVAQFEWRNSYGIFKELKFYTTSDEYYFEQSKGLKEDSDFDRFNIEHQDDAFIEGCDRGNILFVPDITVFHKGLPIYFIEIVYTNPVSEIKLARIIEFFKGKQWCPQVVSIKAEDILKIQKGCVPNYIENKILLNKL